MSCVTSARCRNWPGRRRSEDKAAPEAVTLFSPLIRCQRHDVPAEQRGGAPDRQDPDLPLPGRYGQHVVSAMHQPGGKPLDDQEAELEDAPAETERGDRSEAVMHIWLRSPAAQRGDDVLRQQL